MLYIEKEDCGGGPVITKAKVVIIMRIVMLMVRMIWVVLRRHNIMVEKGKFYSVFEDCKEMMIDLIWSSVIDKNPKSIIVPFCLTFCFV